MIIFCIMHFRGREFENLGKHMVDRIHDWVVSVPISYFKHMSGSVLHFLKWGSAGHLSSFFHPCACMKCFVTMLGRYNLILSFWPYTYLYIFTFFWFYLFYSTIWRLPLIVTLLCDWQCFLSWGGKWRFKLIDAYPLFVLSPVLFCLGTSKRLSMGEFDKWKSCMGIFNYFRLESWD